MIYLINESILGYTRTIRVCNNTHEVVMLLNDRDFIKKRIGKITIDKVVIQ